MKTLAHPDWPYACDKYCKVHYYWDFETQRHEPLPTTYNVRSQAGWRSQVVWVGPPGYYPYRPTPRQLASFTRDCPHAQMDLTCNTCLRHMFRPMEI